MRRRALTLAVAALPLLILFGAVAAYLGYARVVPSYAPPAVFVPKENAYDEYISACGLLSSDTRGIMYASPAPSLQALRKVVAANASAFAALRRGLKHEYAVPPNFSWSRPLSELSQFRTLQWLLLQDGRLHELDGDAKGALNRYLDGLHFATDIPRGGSLAHGSVGRRMEVLALERLYPLVDHLEAPAAKRALQDIRELDKRRVRLAEVLTAFRDQGTQGHLEILRASEPWAAFARSMALKQKYWQDEIRVRLAPRSQIVRDYRAWCDGLIRAAQAPYYQRPPVPPIPGDPMNQLLLTIFSGFQNGNDDFLTANAAREAYWRIVETRLAVRAYTLEHGAPPDRLQNLVPQYLRGVPPDPFAPIPLTYRRMPNGPRVYSVGPDGMDDWGGEVVKLNRTSKGDLMRPHVEQ